VGSPKPRHTTVPVHEDEVLQRIRSLLENGIGAYGLRDDAAVLGLPAGAPLVVSVDSVVEGVHVDLSLSSPADVGWKALMGALSDLAAMGAGPLAALVALCVPGGSGDGALALGVMAGVAEASVASGCPVVGGDMSESAVLTVSVTVLGTVEPGGPPPVGRSGARPGDVLLVTGPCGGSAAGLRELRAGNESGAAVAAYRRPVARLREGELARSGGARAMIDVSDGLALDLHRLADASGVGFSLDEVPAADGATLEDALGGGEDYELLVALGPLDVDVVVARATSEGLRHPTVIGSVVDEVAGRTLRGHALERMGWQHRIG
jgi:thiamine-monophosphate kinase